MFFFCVHLFLNFRASGKTFGHLYLGSAFLYCFLVYFLIRGNRAKFVCAPFFFFAGLESLQLQSLGENIVYSPITEQVFVAGCLLLIGKNGCKECKNGCKECAVPQNLLWSLPDCHGCL